MEQNGCDFWPDMAWQLCCDVHDIAYQQGGNTLDMLKANVDLSICVLQYSPLNAALMFIGVSAGGWLVWRFASLGYKSIYRLITGKEYEGHL